MEKEYVSAIFCSDAWISRSEMRLKAICNCEWMYEEPILREILADHLGDDEEEMERALKDLYEDLQYRGDGFSVFIEHCPMNELC